MPFVEFEGIRIHYQITGEQDLPVLIFSNSLGANLYMWEPQVLPLSAHFRILRYDTRGHGRSSSSAGPYSIADLGADVLRLLDTLQVKRASFCGLSMGGAIGQWLAVHASERLEKVVLANTAAKIGVPEIWNARIDTVLREGLDPVIPGTLERWFTSDFHEAHPEVIANTAAMIKATSVRGYAACCAAIRDADFRNDIESIQTPTLVIAGKYDPVTSPEDGRFLAATIPSAAFVEIPAAHVSNIEAPSQFSAALLSFLLA
jgi:3-oxoadipate enol-lactonase